MSLTWFTQLWFPTLEYVPYLEAANLDFSDVGSVALDPSFRFQPPPGTADVVFRSQRSSLCQHCLLVSDVGSVALGPTLNSVPHLSTDDIATGSQSCSDLVVFDM